MRGDLGIPGLPPSPQPSPYEGEGAGNKVYVSAADLYRPENDAVLMNAVWPRPSYILLTGSGERLHALPLSGGSLQSTEPAVQVPIPRDSDCYRDIKASGEFVIAVPDRACIGLYERLQHSASYDLAAAGFTLLPPNMIATPGLEQCRVNMDCRSVMLEDVPGTDFAILVGRRIGVTLDPDDVAHLDPAQHSLHDRLAYVNSLYASFMYSVLDRGGQRCWGFHDPNDLSVRPLPSWGSRYTGGWWGPGPALNYWMIELCQSGLLTKPDYYKIMHWLRLWNNGALIPHLAEFIDEPMKQELRQRLTILFHMMAWAHRDLAAWQAVRRLPGAVPRSPARPPFGAHLSPQLVSPQLVWSRAMTQHVIYDRPTLPVLHCADAIVAGGSMAGVAAALALAGRGLKVALVESRTYLGSDITATLRPWLTLGEFPISGFLADLAQAAGVTVAGEGEIALKPDALKLFLEDALLAAGVEIVYASYPVQVVHDAGRLAGLVIGNKSGRQVVQAPLVIDATTTSLVARLAGAVFAAPAAATACFTRTLEYLGRLSPARLIPVPAEFGVVDDCLPVHTGYRGLTHKYLEMRMAFTAEPDGYEAMMRRELEARRRSIALAAYLQEQRAEFGETLLAACSYELHGHLTTPMSGDASDWASPWRSQQLSMARSEQPPVALDAGAFAGPLPGLWVIEAARLASSQASLLRDPLAAGHVGRALGELLAETWDSAAQRTSKHVVAVSPAMVSPAAASSVTAPAMAIREQEAPQRGRLYAQQAVAPLAVPVLHSAQALVVGGGTSGAPAAIAAAREGVETTLIEMNPGLGGTQTLGGVTEHWFGRRVGFAGAILSEVQQMDRRLGFHPPSRWHHWSMEGRMHVFLSNALSSGVTVSLYALSIGAIVQGERVCGVVVATPYGPYAVLAGVTIDATGDGDVAAWAGADCVYGAERDHSVLWHSLLQIAAPGVPQGGNFTSMCDVSNTRDYMRSILAGRRRATGIHDHGVYIAPRESRHILGDVVLTFSDQLLHRRWPDVVNVFYSNYDIKGRSATDWNLAGLISANLEIEFPYRAMLPRRLDGIIVAGKAFSADSSAVPTIRMQADLENLGGVAGLAAATAVRHGCSPRQAPLHTLQQKLVEAGVLPAGILGRTLHERRLSPAATQAWIEQLNEPLPLLELNNAPATIIHRQRFPFVEVCTAGPHVTPLLRQALAAATGERRVVLAQALAMCGDAAGVPVLIERINALLGAAGLPARTTFILNTNANLPDHAAMPDVVYLLYSLAMARDRRSLPVWDEVSRRLDFTDAAFRHPFKSPYYYVDALCYGAERLGDPAALPMLERLHRQPLLQGQVLRQGFQVDYMLERLAVLELVIARAMARCGAAGGVATLIDYLDDVRTLLAEHAHSELSGITGQDFGKNAAAWRAWLHSQPAVLPPRPWPGDTDAMRAWQEVILIDS